jgi:hypothetical protein
VPVLGVGRLELDAYPHAGFHGTVVAVHRAGRGDLAWAAYEGPSWRELSPPKLSKAVEIGEWLDGPALLAGEVDEETATSVRATAGTTVSVAPAAGSIRRAGSLAELGFAHLSAGEGADPAILRAVYLRPPAIGPQPQSASR